MFQKFPKLVGLSIQLVLALVATMFVFSPASFAQSVYGASGSQKDYVRPERGFSESARPDYIQPHYTRPTWEGYVGFGVATAQLTRENAVTKENEVVDSNFQMNLDFMAERKIMGPFGAEFGLILSGQFLPTMENGVQGGSTLTLRTVDLPLIARVHFSKMISVGLGTFASIPISEGAELPINQLGAVDLGFIVSSRFTMPANKTVNWVLGFDIQRGTTHLANEVKYPNHIRSFAATAGISGKL